MNKKTFISVLCVLLLLLFSPPGWAANITISATADDKPVGSNGSLPNGALNQSYPSIIVFSVPDSGADNEEILSYTWAITPKDDSSEIPTWLSTLFVVPNNNEFTVSNFTPTDVGTFEFKVTIAEEVKITTTDEDVEEKETTETRNGSANYKLVIGVAPSLNLENLNNNDIKATLNKSYNLTLEAKGSTDIRWEIKEGKLPEGLKLEGQGNGSTAKISGTPKKVGESEVTISVYNDYVNKDYESDNVATFNFTVGKAPSISTRQNDIKDGEVGDGDYSIKIEALGSTDNFVWTVENKPSFLTSADEGEGEDKNILTLSGMPAKADSYTFTVKASNDFGIDTKNYTAKFNAEKPEIPEELFEEIPDGVVGVSYDTIKLEASLNYKGPDENPISFDWSATRLPNGLAIIHSDDAYWIAGVPTRTGTFNSTITVTTSQGGSNSQAITIIVKEGAKIKTPAALPDATVGVKYGDIKFTADGAAPITWDCEGDIEDLGLSFDEETGVLSGTPQKATKISDDSKITRDNIKGSIIIKVTATSTINDKEYSDTKEYTLRVVDVAPTIRNSLIKQGNVGEEYKETFTLSKGTGDIYWEFEGKRIGNNELTHSKLPSGFSIAKGDDDNTVILQGKTKELWSSSFKLAAFNTGSISEKQYNLVIKGSAPEVNPIVENNFTLEAAVKGKSYQEDETSIDDDETKGIIKIKGTPPIAVNVTGLPKGMSVISDDNLSDYNTDEDAEYLKVLKVIGTPAEEGPFKNIVVKASNAAGSASKKFSLAVNSVPVITTTELTKEAVVGKSYSGVKLAATGTKTITWDLAEDSDKLPKGLELNKLTGAITGSPEEKGEDGEYQAGEHKFTVIASNDAGQDTQELTIKVVDVAPKIKNSSLPKGEVDTPYEEVEFEKSAGTGDITWALGEESELPDGLEFDPDTHKLTGTPIEIFDKNITIIATNTGGSVSKTYKLLIKGQPPVITDKDDKEGSLVTTLPNALTTDTEDYTYDNIEVTGTSVDVTVTGLQNTGLDGKYNKDYGNVEISGKPKKEGKYNVVVVAKNDAGSKQRKFVLNVFSAPVITTTPGKLADGTAGKSYNATITATGSKTIVWETKGTLPEGLAITNKGVIKGKIDEKAAREEPYEFTVIASNDVGKDEDKEFSIKVSDLPPTIKTSNLKTAGVDNDYEVIFEAKGTGTITWSYTLPEGTVLPDGLEFETNDGETELKLTGTPTEATDAKGLSFKVTASNTGGDVSKEFKLIVKGVKPTITTTTLPTAKVGDAYPVDEDEVKVYVTGTEPIKYNVVASPTSGFGDLRYDSFDDNDDGKGKGVSFTGNPTKPGKYTITVTAENSSGKATKKYTVTAMAAPKLEDITLPDATVGKSYTGTLKAKEGSTPIYWLTDDDGTKLLTDHGLTLDSKKGVIKGKPTSADEITLLIAASNDIEKTETTNVTFSINAVKPTISGTLKAGTTDKFYKVTLKAKGTYPIKWEDPGLPTGLNYSQDKDGSVFYIEGTPTEAFNDKITITASNGDLVGGGDAKKESSLVIKAVAPKITVVKLPTTVYTESQYEAILEAKTGTAPIEWEVDDLPGGLNYRTGTDDEGNSTTRRLIISGITTETPSEKGGKFPIVITAVNELGKKVTKKVTLKVVGGKDPADDGTNTDKAVPDELAASGDEIPEDEESEAVEPEIIWGAARDESSLSAGELKALEDYIIVAVLPELEVTESGQYEFDVELDKEAPVGAKLLWFAFPQNADPTEDDEIVDFIDESGALIEEVPESKFIVVSPWLTEGVRYAPVIAVEKDED